SVGGGEEEGQKRLAYCLQMGMASQAVDRSAWLAIGCLSVHTVYFSVIGSGLSKKMKESILQGLWWKDYYRFMFKKYGNVFFQEKGYTGNPPEVSKEQFSAFESWRNGTTSNVQVNASMVRLMETGYLDFKSRE